MAGSGVTESAMTASAMLIASAMSGSAMPAAAMKVWQCLGHCGDDKISGYCTRQGRR
jgi:hypothetical protein